MYSSADTLETQGTEVCIAECVVMCECCNQKPTTHLAKLGEITGKTRVLYSELGEITGRTRVLPCGNLNIVLNFHAVGYLKLSVISTVCHKIIFHDLNEYDSTNKADIQKILLISV